jgi:two-component system, OmpR family, copper resistance phosphate regulon response regulator CusR
MAAMVGGMPRVLIAEDDPGVASVLVEGLTAEGFSTGVARDGRDALARAESGEFDLVVLDLGLPVQNGFDVLHELRAHGRSVPVVILTARSSLETTVAGLEAGADDYIAKPFDLDEVVARIRARLREREQAAEN